MASVYDRLTSAFPISLPTALALESLFNPRTDRYDPERKVPQHIDVQKYRTIWINVLLLYRNLVAAMDKSTFLTAKADDLANVLDSDMEVITSLFHVEGLGVCEPIFYFCSYEDLRRVDRRIRLREDVTELQKMFKSKFLQVVQIVRSRRHIHMLNSDIPGDRKNSLIMTHVPYDLLSYQFFNRLDLLESNTGKLKTRHEWNTKYYPVIGNDMSRLPFLKMLLLILGDKVLIHPSDIKLRRMVLDVGERRHWVQTTTVDKIKQDLESEIKDPYILQFLKSL